MYAEEKYLNLSSNADGFRGRRAKVLLKMGLALDWLHTNQGEDPMRYLDDVFRYAKARLGQHEDAEDIAIEVVQALPNPCRRRELRAYMIGMARRKVADRLRRKPAPADHQSATTSFESSSNEAAQIEAALAQISPEYRELLVLKYVLGFSSEEIGKAIGKRSTAVDSALQRARASFETIWQTTTQENEDERTRL